jgi:DNA-binding CsgD family transcriptional regulator
MAELPAPNRSASQVRRENVSIRVSGNMAWITFDQYAPNTGEPMDVPGMSRVLRVLERHDGNWKIACASFLHPSLDHVAAALVRVDGASRVEWIHSPAERAIANGCGLAVSAGRLRATGRAGDQRLQAAIRSAARLDEDIESRRETRPVVLDGARGEPANVCWIVADSGMIHVSINDARLIEERLETAAVVYGLSPSQLRLADHVVSGLGLRDAADRLGVSLATVRTQLERMFDKTGVRSQPALVRALLSVTAPLG